MQRYGKEEEEKGKDKRGEKREAKIREERKERQR